MVTLLLMVLTSSPDAGSPRVLLGEQFGVPVYAPDLPWTRAVPAGEGSVHLADVTQSTSGDTLSYAAARATLAGAAMVELAKKKLPSRRVTVRFRVEQGKVRVFLKYALDVAVFCEASAPASCTLEGVVWQSPGLRPAVLLQSLEGDAVVRDFTATTGP